MDAPNNERVQLQIVGSRLRIVLSGKGGESYVPEMNHPIEVYVQTSAERAATRQDFTSSYAEKTSIFIMSPHSKTGRAVTKSLTVFPMPASDASDPLVARDEY